MTGTPRTTGRHRAARRHRWILPVALALVVAVATALLGVGGTYALWNGTASTAATTVKSATATITVGTLSTMNTTVLGPGTGVTGTFAVKNTGSIPLSMRVATTSTNVAYATNASSAAVLGELTLRLTNVSSAAACTAGLSGASGRLAAFDTGSGSFTLQPGASTVGCVELVLDADAPQSVSGAVTDFTLTVTGTQVSA
ncbi:MULTISPECIES: TasA family protein [Bacteria]|uniref:TasA family protein n=1 Tax=Bacteria TaxID=2 RepID=UPI000F4791CD|nr:MULTISPECIES: TasA family protein [unclassified Curtobacterium]ROS47320.1 camelysin-like metallo-endopeptidase [Curtobacterium sp. PhB78]TCU85420.1 camelysin-like metallo-endopeptidase [Curtobacterium sp. PhB191]TDW46938.1 camelysin-like metallo-endopeptidase [Curtobacterium sp. PhB42]TDW57262.1 camelysin-like metallo-endopeptidase [Curtobacterium sp. PhB190]TDW71944.1 camelysin-like metallo-endopeptidase [Curtobacterium sp. PhB25]